MTSSGILSEEPGSPLIVQHAKTPPEGWTAHGEAIPIEQQFAALTSTLGNGAAADVLHTFVNQANLLLTDLHIYIEGEDFNSAVAALHELSNTCTVVGAKTVSYCCIEIDDAIRNGDWNEARIVFTKLLESTKLIRIFVRKLSQSA